MSTSVPTDAFPAAIAASGCGKHSIQLSQLAVTWISTAPLGPIGSLKARKAKSVELSNGPKVAITVSLAT